MDEPNPENAGDAATIRHQAVRGGTIVFVARFVAQMFQWSVTLFVARLLLPDDYGMMTSGTLFLGLADMLAEAGVGKALVQKKAVTQEDFVQGFTLSLLLSALLFLLLYFLASPAALFLKRPDFELFLRVLALAVFLNPWRSVAGAILERELRLGQWSAVQLSAAAIQAVIVLVMAYAGFGYWALACGALTGRTLETAFLWYASSWKLRLALPSREAIDLLRYGIHISAASLLWVVYNNSDFAVVGFLLGPVTLGYYALAFQLISLPVQKISATVNQVMFTVYCRLQDDRARQRDWYLRLTALQSAVAMPALAGMALVADDGIPLLLGAQWRPAILPLKLLCPVGALLIVSSTLLPLLNALGRPDINLKYTATCAALFPIGFLAAGWWGIQEGGDRGGLIGICAVWLVQYPLIVIGLISLTTHLSGVSLGDVLRCHVPILTGVVVMLICVLAVQWAMEEERTVLRLAAAIGAGAASYTLWILLTTRATLLADIALVGRELRGRKAPA